MSELRGILTKPVPQLNHQAQKETTPNIGNPLKTPWLHPSASASEGIIISSFLLILLIFLKKKIFFRLHLYS